LVLHDSSLWKPEHFSMEMFDYFTASRRDVPHGRPQDRQIPKQQP
jgi:hypothetical protein